jgi:aldehyde:ferredoxin oxidoreductase
MCLFIAFCVLDQPETFQAMLDVMSGFAGANLTADDVAELGKSVLKKEREFNLAAGLSNKEDRLPEYFRKEPLAPHNITFEVSDEDLDKVHDF